MEDEGWNKRRSLAPICGMGWVCCHGDPSNWLESAAECSERGGVVSPTGSPLPWGSNISCPQTPSSHSDEKVHSPLAASEHYSAFSSLSLLFQPPSHLWGQLPSPSAVLCSFLPLSSTSSSSLSLYHDEILEAHHRQQQWHCLSPQDPPPPPPPQQTRGPGMAVWGTHSDSVRLSQTDLHCYWPFSSTLCSPPLPPLPLALFPPPAHFSLQSILPHHLPSLLPHQVHSPPLPTGY